VRKLLSLCALSLLAACAAPTPPAPATLHVAATDLAAPLLSDLIAAYAEVNPDISLIPATVPLSTLSSDLASGQIDLALGVSADPTLPWATPLGYVSFAVVVNSANPLDSLSAAQVKEIFAGRVMSWGQVGGPEGEIEIISREDASDAARAFGDAALSGAIPTPNALVAPSWEAMREAVSQNPNAIGYLPLPELDATVKRVRVDADWRALVVAVAVQEPASPSATLRASPARDFLAWAQSEEGQRVVARRYEPVR
jgi:phosphate transport system substrate-binding protein